MRAVVLTLAGAVALGGCASDKLTLLENEDGAEIGSVAVINEKRGDEVVVNTKLTEAKLTSRPKPRAVKELKPAYTQLLSNLPPKAVAFVITFGLGETRIPEAQRGTVDKIRAALAERSGAQIEVVGFTDSTGDDNFNDKVSEKRALAVISELREGGFPVEDEDAVGRGERAARANGGPDDYPNELFRKVEVVVR